MPYAITAVYENGVFVPTTKIMLPEHTTVTVRIPASSKSAHRFAGLVNEPLPADHLDIPSREQRHE